MRSSSLHARFRLLERRRGFMETVLRSLQEGVLVVSAEGNVDYANPTAEAMLGFELSRARGRPASRYLPDVDWAALARGEDGDGWERLSSAEIEILRPRRRILALSAFPLAADGDAAPDDAAPGGGVVAILRDVTREREDTLAALESRHMEAMHRWAADLAHEIGNPINNVSLHLQLLRRAIARLPEGPDRDDLSELQGVASDELSRLGELLSRYLSALRDRAPVLAPCDVRAELERTLAAMGADIQAHNIAVEVSAPARLPVVQADAVQLRQAFFNLVHNAVQAMGEGGRLAIALTADDRDLVVAFRDSGSGIDREDFGRLFEPFHTTKAEGHGIGLSVVQRIVRAHGGRIDVASKPGEGTCFRISLPLADRRARLLPGAPPPPPQPSGASQA